MVPSFFSVGRYNEIRMKGDGLMQYREFGKTGLKASVLGFGMMRMPRNEKGEYDESWTIENLRYAIDHGLNYVDTAYIYGESERLTGLALRDGYREKVILASKMPVGMFQCEEDFDRILAEELERLQTDHIDVYLLHALNRGVWDNKVLKFNVLAKAEKAMADGKIHHLGFSFHDDLEAFRYILNAYDKWEFCQIQLNYMDINYQAGLQGLQEAAEMGLPVVIMEPLRGGRLADVPEEVAAMLPASAAESALTFLWNRPEVAVVLSGMSSREQLDENMAMADRARVGMLTREQEAQMVRAGDKMRELISIPCTACGYCDVCPQSVAIPEIFAIQNRLQLDGNSKAAGSAYRALGERMGSACAGCGLCAEKCPQHIDIPRKLEKLHKRFTEE